MIKISSPSITKKEIKAVSEVMESKWLVEGNITAKFEKRVAEYVGSKFAIAVNSGTAALHLALLALKIKKDDMVIVPALTFPATANVIESIGAEAVFVDVDKETFNMDPEKLLSKVGELENKGLLPRLKAVIPVHLAGQSAEMNKIIGIAKKYNLKIIEDAACALGAEYKGKKCGSMGNLGCFSFHPRKVITTGEGGMVVTNDAKLAESVGMYKNHGIKSKNEKKIFMKAGLNYRMTDISAAIGVEQMKKIDKLIAKNIKIAKIYNDAFLVVDGVKAPTVSRESKHIYQAYSLMLKKEVNRDKIIKILKKQGIEANFLTYALHEQPYYRDKYRYKKSDFPVASLVFEHSLAIPLHQSLTMAEANEVINRIKSVLNYEKKGRK